MKALPASRDALVLRTDFSNDAAWDALCAAIRNPSAEFQAYVDFVSDPDFDGIMSEDVVAVEAGSNHAFVFIADRRALSDPDQPVLVVDLRHQPGRTFRVIPSEMWGVENNLSIANLDFEDFVAHVDPHGVFRGFPAD